MQETRQISAPFKVGGPWWFPARKHRLAELSLYLLLASGLSLWTLFDLAWGIERSLLLTHSLMGLLLFPALLAPFWLTHRALLKRSDNQWLKLTGQLLDAILLILAASGFYLLLIGNRGGWSEALIADVHFYASFALLPPLVRHTWRWSAARTATSLRQARLHEEAA